MDIVEQLRKHQCPENKGCNPVVEYCQCALMDSGADEIERLGEKYEKLLRASVAFQIAIQNAMFVFEKTVDDIHQKDSE